MPKASPQQLRCLIAFALYWSWTFCVALTNTFSLGAQFGPMGNPWLVSTTFHALTLILFIVAEKRFPRAIQPRSIFVLMPSACLGGFALVLSSTVGGQAVGDLAFMVVGSAMTGIGTGLFIIAWARPFAECFSDRGYLLALYASIVLSAVVNVTLSVLPGQAFLIVCVVMPVVFAMMVPFSPDDGAAPKGEASKVPASSGLPEEYRLSWRFAAFCLVFPIPLGLFQTWFKGSIGIQESWIAVLAPSVIVLIIVAAAELLAEKRGVRRFSERLVMPIMVAGLFIWTSFDEGLGIATGCFVFVSQQIMSVVLYARFASIGSKGDISPTKSYALGVAMTDAGFLVGMAAANVAEFIAPGNFGNVVLCVAYVLVIVAFVATGEDFGSLRGKRAADGPFESLGQVGARHGLTQREQELLEYLVSGKSVPAIASEVYLSVNTVRTHIAHIYQKFDVHSRDELVDAIDNEAIRGVFPGKQLH